MFHIEVRPEPSDIDELDHVSNLVYLRWVQQVAVAHSDAVGWTFDAYRRLGAVWLVKRHELDYQRPARLGDTLTLRTWVGQWSRASCWRETRICRDETVLVQARTRWAFVDLTRGRPCRIPDELMLTFGGNPSPPA
ncbi:MAG: acyl-CoA thioesterase [Deltaproteobacteria bacterium]|nr:acyl-CoA thioesterase [Deltaproteobacteria bacterium]